MKMKKVISVVLACACVFSFAACGSKSDSSKSDSAKSDKKEKLVMATNAEFPPFEYYDGMKLSESMQNSQQQSLTSLEWI